MARPRKLKTYGVTRSGVGREFGDLLGEQRQGFRQVRAIVAAHSLVEARLLMGVSTGDMNHSGSITEHPESVAITMAEPGQVFVRRLGVQDDRPWVRARPTGRMLVPGTSDLELAAELVEKERAEKAARKETEARWVREAEERAQRNAESDRRASEALDRLRPILGEHGVHPDTIGVQVHGVWLPPEVAETIADLLVELGELRAL